MVGSTVLVPFTYFTSYFTFVNSLFFFFPFDFNSFIYCSISNLLSFLCSFCSFAFISCIYSLIFSFYSSFPTSPYFLLIFYKGFAFSIYSSSSYFISGFGIIGFYNFLISYSRPSVFKNFKCFPIS